MELVTEHKEEAMSTTADFLTTYRDTTGTEHPAVQVPWEEIKHLLGRPHDGSPEDDEQLMAYFTDAEAPDWFHDREGGIEGSWIDERGWGVYGPAA